MLERLVANWLTSAGERGYETAFAQLLALEGYRVLHGPVHHPFEHGKDIVAVSRDNELHAFQLKGGSIGLSDLEAIMQQLLAMAATPVTYPGVDPPRKPDKAFLVANGKLSAPARDRLAQFNAANQGYAFALVECIEVEQLIGRFVKAQGDFLPVEPRELERILRIYLADGRSLFPIQDYLAITGSLIDDPERATGQSRKLQIARAALLTNYMLTPWLRHENHLAIAQGWLSLCLLALERRTKEWDDESWLPSFEIGLAAARSSLAGLAMECSSAEDLLVPDMFDGYVYGTRALIVCGYLAAFLRSDSLLDDDRASELRIVEVLRRESKYVRVLGEVASPYILAIAGALVDKGFPSEGLLMATLYSKDLAAANRPDSPDAAADPYHSFEELLEHSGGAASRDEDFAGSSYSLLTAIHWIVRRGGRMIVEKLWPVATTITHMDFQLSDPGRMLSREDPDGELVSRLIPITGSWAQLSDEASHLPENRLPAVLWQHLEFLPYLPLLLPHRFTSDLAKALDYAFGGLTKITYADESVDTPNAAAS